MNDPSDRLSDVVITRNRLNKLERCLDSVKAKLPGAEVIVVDNGSTDGTASFLKKQGDKLTIKLLEANAGVTVARNIGIRLASRKCLLFLDDDAWIDRLPVEEIVSYLFGSQNIGIIAPRILYPDSSLQESARSFPTIMALFWRGTKLYKLFPDVGWYRRYIDNDQSSIHPVDWAILACMVVKREMFERFGPLDEGYSLNYEDVEFCRRIKKGGCITVYWPDATVFHDYSRPSAKGINRQFFKHIASILRFYSKG